MRSVHQKIIRVVPVLPVLVTAALWILSYSYAVQVAIHGSGPGYVYFDSGLGRMSVGRCFDDQDRWRGVRHSLCRVHDYPDLWILQTGSTFDVAYMDATGIEETRVWFPHWALCLACALWPARCVYTALQRRLSPAPCPVWA